MKRAAAESGFRARSVRAAQEILVSSVDMRAFPRLRLAVVAGPVAKPQVERSLRPYILDLG